VYYGIRTCVSQHLLYLVSNSQVIIAAAERVNLGAVAAQFFD